MKLKKVSRFGAFGLFLMLSVLFAGCGYRALTEKDVVGTYEADAQWGKSVLILHSDHSFDQTVARNDHTQTSIKGTWKLDMWRGKKASDGILVLKPFLDVEHDHNGELADGAVPSISRGLIWGIRIAADPDWGITFTKR